MHPSDRNALIKIDILPTIPSLPDSLERAVSCPKTSRFDKNDRWIGTVELGPWQLPRDISHEMRRDAAVALQGYEEWLKPASHEFIAERISSMFAHRYARSMNEMMRSMVALDWIRALQEFPAAIIETVRQEWVFERDEQPRIPPFRRRCVELTEPVRRVCERLRRIATERPDTPSAPERAQGLRPVSSTAHELVSKYRSIVKPNSPAMDEDLPEH